MRTLQLTPATGSAAPQCGAAYPQNATPRSLARPRRTGVRRSQRPRGLKRVRSPVRLMIKAHARTDAVGAAPRPRRVTARVRGRQPPCRHDAPECEPDHGFKQHPPIPRTAH